MLFEVLKDESGKFYSEKIPLWRNNPACVKLLNVKSEEEAEEILRDMNAIAEEKNPAEKAESSAVKPPQEIPQTSEEKENSESRSDLAGKKKHKQAEV